MKRVIQNNLIIFCISSLILVITLSIGFASITSIDLSVLAGLNANMQNDVYIYDIELINNESLYIEADEPSYESSMFHSNITLSNNINSKITYKVSLKNNSNIRNYYEGTSPSISDIENNLIEGGTVYSNTDILFKVVDENGDPLTQNTYIDADGLLDVYVVFYYKDTPQNNNTLEAMIRLNFANNHTVHFNSNGGTTVNDIIVSNGGTIDPIPITTKDGSNFIGWEDSLGNFLTTSTIITSDITYNAIWGINGYTVTFDSNGGDFDTSVIIGENQMISTVFTVLPVPHKDGYRFLGWYHYNGNNVSILDLNTVINSDITYIAEWADISDHQIVDDYTVLVEDLEVTNGNPSFAYTDFGINVEAGKTIETIVKFEANGVSVSDKMNLLQMGSFYENIVTFNPSKWCYQYIIETNKLYTHNYHSFYDEPNTLTPYTSEVTLKYVYSYYDTNNDNKIDRVVYYIYDISDGTEREIDTGISIENVEDGPYTITNARGGQPFNGEYKVIKVKEYNTTKRLLIDTPDNLQWSNVASHVSCNNRNLSWNPTVNGSRIEIKEKRVIEVKINFSWAKNRYIYNNTLMLIGHDLSPIQQINNTTLARSYFVKLNSNTNIRRLDSNAYRNIDTRIRTPNSIKNGKNTIIIKLNYLSPTLIKYEALDENGNSILQNSSGNNIAYQMIEPSSHNLLFNYKGNLQLSNEYGTSIYGTYNSIDVRYWDEVVD